MEEKAPAFDGPLHERFFDRAIGSEPDPQKEGGQMMGGPLFCVRVTLSNPGPLWLRSSLRTLRGLTPPPPPPPFSPVLLSDYIRKIPAPVRINWHFGPPPTPVLCVNRRNVANWGFYREAVHFWGSKMGHFRVMTGF